MRLYRKKRVVEVMSNSFIYTCIPSGRIIAVKIKTNVLTEMYINAICSLFWSYGGGGGGGRYLKRK